jgi:hypothetical protein
VIVKCLKCGATNEPRVLPGIEANSKWVTVDIWSMVAWDESNGCHERFYCLKCGKKWFNPITIT